MGEDKVIDRRPLPLSPIRRGCPNLAKRTGSRHRGILRMHALQLGSSFVSQRPRQYSGSSQESPTATKIRGSTLAARIIEVSVAGRCYHGAQDRSIESLPPSIGSTVMNAYRTPERRSTGIPGPSETFPLFPAFALQGWRRLCAGHTSPVKGACRQGSQLDIARDSARQAIGPTPHGPDASSPSRFRRTLHEGNGLARASLSCRFPCRQHAQPGPADAHHPVRAGSPDPSPLAGRSR